MVLYMYLCSIQEKRCSLAFAAGVGGSKGSAKRRMWGCRGGGGGGCFYRDFRSIKEFGVRGFEILSRVAELTEVMWRKDSFEDANWNDVISLLHTGHTKILISAFVAVMTASMDDVCIEFEPLLLPDLCVPIPDLFYVSLVCSLRPFLG